MAGANPRFACLIRVTRIMRECSSPEAHGAARRLTLPFPPVWPIFRWVARLPCYSNIEQNNVRATSTEHGTAWREEPIITNDAAVSVPLLCCLITGAGTPPQPSPSGGVFLWGCVRNSKNSTTLWGGGSRTLFP